MQTSLNLDIRVAAAAAADAIASALWERVDLQTRRPGLAWDELMLGRAAELAMSPVARDQLMSLALGQAARPVSAAPPLLDLYFCTRERSVITDRILTLGPHRASETMAVVHEIEAWHAKRLSQDARFDLLAACLKRDAVLQEAFWNHPCIPATDAVRLTMLCSIPRLQDRAEALAPVWTSWSAPKCWFPKQLKRTKHQ